MLEGGQFSRIKMNCTVLSEDNQVIKHKLQQTGCNSFSISIKRSRDRSVESESKRSKKGGEKSTIEPAHETNGNTIQYVNRSPLNENLCKKLKPKSKQATDDKTKTVRFVSLKASGLKTIEEEKIAVARVSCKEKSTIERAHVNQQATNHYNEEGKSVAIKKEDPSKKKKNASSRGKKKSNENLPSPCEHVNEGEVVLCQMRGFSAWPSRVIEIVGDLVQVRFFGDQTTYKTTVKHLYPFHKSHAEIISNLNRLKNPLYSKSVQEAESVLKIPKEKSIFTRTMQTIQY